MGDERLERIYDYTKWHLGIYLSVAGTLTAALGFLAKPEEADTLRQFLGSPKLLLTAIVLMFLAGICGGVVASSCTGCKTYEELWEDKHGPYGIRIMPGRYWAALEHTFFWASAGLAAYAVLSSTPVVGWLFPSKP
jgi:hypothetical protein